MIGGCNFRLFYRVALGVFCFIFAYSYRGGSSRYVRREEKTEPKTFRRQFTDEDPSGDDTEENIELGNMGKTGNF